MHSSLLRMPVHNVVGERQHVKKYKRVGSASVARHASRLIIEVALLADMADGEHWHESEHCQLAVVYMRLAAAKLQSRTELHSVGMRGSAHESHLPHDAVRDHMSRLE